MNGEDKPPTKKERRTVKRTEREAEVKRARRNKTVKNYGVLAAISLLIAGGGYWLFAGTDITTTEFDVTKVCTTHARPAIHIHPNLTILIDGDEQEIPTNTGITPGCMRSLHTHDDTGQLHVEPPIVRDNTLGEFFTIWGKTFGREHILDRTVDATHELVMRVNGETSEEYGDLILEDQQRIFISYKEKAAESTVEEPPEATEEIEGEESEEETNEEASTDIAEE